VLAREFPKGHAFPTWPPFDTNVKMNPPLRSQHDRAALIEGLRDGTLEIIGSDHAPHSGFEKEVEFDYAPFGITGLETELSLSLMRLYHTGELTLPKLLDKFTVQPAKLLRIEKGTLDIGADGDVTIFDPELRWTYQRDQTASKSQNSPFHGWAMRGKAVATIVRGKIVWREMST
jgi:dihydroorotase